MPLLKEILKQKILSFSDSESQLFIGTPEDIDDNANKWADAIGAYTSIIFPAVLPTSTLLARQSFVAIMKGLKDPIQEDSTFRPFTLYYISPESRLHRFNRYLKDKVGYKSNPLLDKTETFTILNNIRDEYNKLYPLLELTTEDILYNQNRFNQIYSKEILEGKVIPLLQDGVTTNTKDLRYKFIPVSKDGRIIRLQNDGIIGDDTIRYLPIIDFIVYSKRGNTEWNIKYNTIKYITQPHESGEIWAVIPLKLKDGNFDTKKRASSIAFKRDIIDKGISKDFSVLSIDKTQSQIDGLSPSTLMNDFIRTFELNHSTCDPIWIDNKLKTIDEYMAFKSVESNIYKNTPSAQKDGLDVLENAIKSYATQLAIGMNPTFTASPSPAPINLKTVTAKGLSGSKVSECVDFIANLIDIYFKSGTATNNSSGATTTWN